MNRKRVVLVALLGVLAVCLIYAYLATPRLEKATPRAANPRTQAVDLKPSAGDKKVADDRIDFAYLSSAPQEFTGAQRDIFRFGQRRPVKAASVPTPTPRVMQQVIMPPVAQPEPVPVEMVRRSLSQFTFLGFLEKSGEKTVFLSSGGEMFLVTQGEHFGTDREFRVEEIDDKLLKVRHVGREGLIVIELIEKEKLNARPIVRQARQISMDDGSSMADGNVWPENKRRGLREILNPDTPRQSLPRPGAPEMPVRQMPRQTTGS